MDMNNVKLDWAPILEGQIKYLETSYPDLPIRKSFVPIIEALNANKMKSRVVLSGINVSAYAFITPSVQHTDRLYATVGFTDPKFATEERTDNLMSWLEDHARIQNKYMMLNELFNAEEKSDEFLFSRNYRKLVRDRLVIDLGDLMKLETPLTENLGEVDISKIKAADYSDIEYEAFRGSEDEILFNSGNRDERIEFCRGLFDGSLGKVIGPASKVLMQGNKIAAALVATDYRSVDDLKSALIADIFVRKNLRGKGIAKYLLANTLNVLKIKGYDECALWVSTNNPARGIYDKLGFRDSGTKEVFYYLKP